MQSRDYAQWSRGFTRGTDTSDANAVAATAGTHRQCDVWEYILTGKTPAKMRASAEERSTVAHKTKDTLPPLQLVEKDKPPQHAKNKHDSDVHRTEETSENNAHHIRCPESGIISRARESIGRPMWAQSPFAGWTRRGRLGCAASVSEVLQESGYNYANSALAVGLADQLIAHGWHKVRATRETLVPGAVIFGYRGNPYKGGGRAHIGIVGERESGQTWIFDNSSISRVWTHRPLHRTSFQLPPNNTRFGRNVYVLIPPGHC